MSVHSYDVMYFLMFTTHVSSPASSYFAKFLFVELCRLKLKNIFKILTELQD